MMIHNFFETIRYHTRYFGRCFSRVTVNRKGLPVCFPVCYFTLFIKYIPTSMSSNLGLF